MVRIASRGFTPFPARQLNIKMLDLCNASCSFCGYNRERLGEKVRQGHTLYRLDVDALIARLPALRRKGIGTLHLTGGEPTLHPRFVEFVRRAKEEGFQVRSGTNGSLLDGARIDALAASGIDFLWYSLDTFPFPAHLAHRGFTSLAERMEASLRRLVASGINVFGQTVLSRVLPLADDRLPDIEGHLGYYARHFGLRRFVFSYPMHRPDGNAHADGESPAHRHLATEGGDAVAYSREELMAILRKVLRQKDKPGTTIVNPYLGLLQQIRELEGRDTHLPCMAGRDIFFLGSDEASLRPCYHHSEIRVDTLDDQPLRASDAYASCRDCRDQCFRDPSLVFGPLHRPGLAFKQMRLDPLFAEYAWRDLADVLRHRGYRHAS